MATARIATHAGAGSDPKDDDATDEAARVAAQALEAGASPIDAACQAVASLEDDPRFNAGDGSYLRSDGRTVQMDAAVADSHGRFGAVACIERVQHPVLVAREVLATEHILLAGEGARRFARSRGFPDHEPRPAGDEPRGQDTVGCVVTDGRGFGAALSSGGTRDAMVGRVGDVPLPGAGLAVGGGGAVAATGHGETIAIERVADRALADLEAGAAPETVVDRSLERFPQDRSMGLILIGEDGQAGGCNRSMAYSSLSL